MIFFLISLFWFHQVHFVPKLFYNEKYKSLWTINVLLLFLEFIFIFCLDYIIDIARYKIYFDIITMNLHLLKTIEFRPFLAWGNKIGNIYYMSTNKNIFTGDKDLYHILEIDISIMSTYFIVPK